MSTVGAHERAATIGIEAALASLEVMNAADLRSEWVRVYRFHPPRKLSPALIKLGVAWKLQERLLGGQTAATKRQLAELARTMDEKADLTKARTITPRPGARLMREWGGETHEVLVADDGFLWQGKTWRSLSVIAREITGTQWSGPRFFGLTGAAAKSVTTEAVTEGHHHE